MLSDSASLAECQAEIVRLRYSLYVAHLALDSLNGNDPCSCTVCVEQREVTP